jgi:hypothetical protein
VPKDVERQPSDAGDANQGLPHIEMNPTHGVHFSGRDAIQYEEISALPDGVDVMRVEDVLLVSSRPPKKTPDGISMTTHRIKRFLRLEALEHAIVRGEPLPPPPKTSLTQREIAEQVALAERPLLPGQLATAQLIVVGEFGADTYKVPAREPAKGPYDRNPAGVWLPIYRK